MKIGDSIIFILIGIFLGIAAHSCVVENLQDNPSEYSCSSIEEARLAMALSECSDAVMGYVWGDIEQ